MKKLGLFLIAIVLLMSSASAKDKKMNKDIILDQHFSAKYTNLDKSSIPSTIKSCKSTFSMLDNENTPIDVAFLYENPGKYRIEAVIDSIPSILGSDGENYWGKIPPYKFVQTFSKPILEDSYTKFVKPVCEYDDYLRILQDSGYSIKLSGKESIDSHEYYKFYASKNEEHYTIYLDSEDFLIKKIEGKRLIKNQPVNYSYTFSEYKAVKVDSSEKSILKPFKIVYSYKTSQINNFVINVNEIVFNPNYEERAFFKPEK